MDWETNNKALQLTLDELTHLLINPSRLIVLNNSELGIGGYGEVCLATLDGSSQVAVKQLRIVQAQGTRVRVAMRLAREMRIWAKAKHPNVLELLGYYLSENYVCAQLISPYMAHGNVTDYIKRTQADLGIRLGFVEGITSGMAYLHSCSPPICHGDIKPANVLVNDEPNAVLCDFGLATFVEGSQAVSGLTTSRSIKGSTRYMSPELFLDNQAKHTLESDVWGWGCTIFEIVTNCIPYSCAPGDAHVISSMVQGQPPGSIESLPKADMPFRPTLNALQILIPDCWNNDPTKRPPSSHILLQLPHIGHPQDNPNANTNENEEPGAGDDSRTYCYCDRVSYGEMIGCDDGQCQREWFHLGCLGMTVPPKGEWFCDECKARKEKGKARTKKKRTRRTSFEFDEMRPVVPAQPHDSKRAVKRARTSSLRDTSVNRSPSPNQYVSQCDGFKGRQWGPRRSICLDCYAREEKAKSLREGERALKVKKMAQRRNIEVEEELPVVPAQPHDSTHAVKRAGTSSLLDVVADHSSGPNEHGHHDHGFASSPTFDDGDLGQIDSHLRAYGGTPDDSSANVPAGNANMNRNGEHDDDDDRRTYCYCDRASYGEMIGCDDDLCQREWFHIGCVGMTTFPKGEWVCDECKARRKKGRARKKSGRSRGGK